MSEKLLTHAEKLMWLAEREGPWTGKVPRFPTLRRKCPNYDAIAHYKKGSGWTLEACQERQAFCRSGKDECQGRGWIPVDSLGATAKAGWLIFEFQIHPQVEYRGVGDGPVLDYILACAKGDNEAAIAALYEAKKAEVKL